LVSERQEPYVFSSRHLDNVKWSLNDTLFPRVVMNYWRKHLPKPLAGGVVPMAIRALHEGKVYCKTSDLRPSDMSTANAGLIFRIVKDAVVTEDSTKLASM
jgi:hypothetical protein